MLRIAVIGAGRIGKIHAANVARNPRTRFAAVVDPNVETGRALARALGAPWTGDAQAAIADREVDAILIASPSDTHVELIERAAAAGKPILCEKPLDVDIGKVERCLTNLARTPAPMLLGFNRRFDPSAEALKGAVEAGEIGTVRQVIISSRDPAPPLLEMLPSTGGLFRDMTILLHFFLERYAQSYARELDAFIDALESASPMPVTGEDGRRALLLADAALQSVQTGQPVRV